MRVHRVEHGIAEFDVVGGGDAEFVNALVARWDWWQIRPTKQLDVGNAVE